MKIFKRSGAKAVDSKSELDEKLVSAFVDGELGEKEARELRARLGANEQGVVSCLEEFKGLRQGIRDWLRQGYLDSSGVQRKVDVWSKIEGEVSLLAEERRLGSSAVVRQTFSDFVAWLYRPQVGFAGVGALAVGLFFVFFVARENGDSVGERLASVPQPEVTDSLLEPRVVPNTVNVSHSAPLVMSEATRDAYRRSIRAKRRSSAHAAALARVLDKNFILGGLRASDSDIDWIRSKRQVQLFVSQDKGAPPIIWAARKSASFPTQPLPLDRLEEANSLLD